MRWVLVLVVLILVDSVTPRRGGVSMGRTGGGTRGSSASRGHGLFGGGSKPKPASQPRPSGNIGNTGGNQYHRNTNYGGGGNTGKSGGLFSNTGGRQQSHNTNWNRNTQPMTSKYSKSGVGSFVRSNQFKNAIVGAAAGYLAYQAGKHIIRAAAGPMMWNSRPYYWGSNYYQPRAGYGTTCRMPVDASDSTFGNVYFQDQTRPREIVWGCASHEHCCGYECCPGGYGGGGGYGGYYRGTSPTSALPFGYAALVLYVLRGHLF